MEVYTAPTCFNVPICNLPTNHVSTVQSTCPCLLTMVITYFLRFINKLSPPRSVGTWNHDTPKVSKVSHTNYPAWNNIAPLGWLAGAMFLLGSVSHVGKLLCFFSGWCQHSNNTNTTCTKHFTRCLLPQIQSFKPLLFSRSFKVMFCDFFASRETSPFGKYQWHDLLYSSTTGNMNGQKHDLLDRTDFVMDFFGPNEYLHRY